MAPADPNFSVSEICAALHRAYGSPRFNNKRNPLSELLFILISQKTGDWNYEPAYRALRRAFPSWNRLRSAPPGAIARALKIAGLSNSKAARIKSIADQLHRDFGRATLAPLHRMSDQDAERYLMSLAGVAEKTAKCVLMYSLDRRVLPVDTHVRRISTRLGLLEEGASERQAHEALAVAVPPSLRYRFHVNAVVHGRTVCTKRPPACDRCPIRAACPWPERPPTRPGGAASPA